MANFFFSGSVQTKLDEKNRFVLPQAMRYGLIENGQLEFTIALGLGGCLTIYRNSEISKIAEKFRKKQHIYKYQRFFTLFFSTLHTTTCDKLGRIVLPSMLKKAVGITTNLVIAGVLNKIEIWSEEKYEQEVLRYLSPELDQSLISMTEDAFALLGDEDAQEMIIDKSDESQEDGVDVEPYFCNVT